MNTEPVIKEEARMMSIQELAGKHFFIPAYQRGFRWNRQQVKDLIDDLFEFSQSLANLDHVYCLQPIVVRKRQGDEYEVIDGQQRLTAIWLLSQCYKRIGNLYQNNAIEYDLTYEGKEHYSGVINRISSASADTPISDCFSLYLRGNDVVASSSIDIKNLESIYHYITEVYTTANNKNHFMALYEIFNKGFEHRDIQIIWDELIVHAECGATELREEAAVIDKFTNINANKIALTEAELIKAHLLAKVEDPEGTAHTWEMIERNLSNDQLWFFIAASEKDERSKKYQTRIDFLFDIWFQNSDVTIPAGDHQISRAAQAIIDGSGDETQKKENANKMWREVVHIYETLLDWHNDYFLYHTIGLLIEVSRDPAKRIKDLYCQYRQKSKKSEFNNYLLDQLVSDRSFSKYVSKEGGKKIVSNPDDIRLEMNYKYDKTSIKQFLLLYNIALLVNAQAISPQNKYERFPFDYYKNTENPIEVEHINPQNPRDSIDDSIEWAKETLKKEKIDTSRQDETRRTEFLEKLESKEIKELSEQQIEWIESLANVHAFNNLTLLDKNLNIRYSNFDLREKRKHLIAAIFGLPVPKASLSEDEQYYEKSVIFPGTKWVFLREYADPKDEVYWSETDKGEYEKSVKLSVFKYLKGAQR